MHVVALLTVVPTEEGGRNLRGVTTALPMQHIEEFVQTAVSQAVTEDVAELVQPSGQALSAALDRAVVGGIETA